jgi:hypothetical protein
VTSIGVNCFRSAGVLTNLVFGSAVVTVGGGVCFGVSSITSVTWTGAPSIPDYAFAVCSGLSTMTIPSSVDFIGRNSFWASGLTRLYFEGNAPDISEFGYFLGINPTVYYRAGTTGWTNPWRGLTTAEWTSYSDPMP